MHPVLQELSDAYGRELSGRDAAWCGSRPLGNERAWSAQQLCGHLVLTWRGTSAALKERLVKGRPTRAPVTLTQWMQRVVVLSFGYMPNGIQAPPAVCPEQMGWPPMNGTDLATTLNGSLEIMNQLLDDCRERFGSQRVASHFRFGPLSVDQWRRFHAIHGWHHMKQLKRIWNHA